MPNVNENHQSSEPFQKDTPVTEQQNVSSENIPETVTVGHTKSAPGERLKKMKMSLEKLITAMKQPDEEEILDTDDNSQQNTDTDNINPHEESVKVQEVGKTDENAEFVIKDIFADVGGTPTANKENIIYNADTLPEVPDIPDTPVQETAKTVSADIPSESSPNEIQGDFISEKTAKQMWEELPEYNIFTETQNNVVNIQPSIIKAVGKTPPKPSPLPVKTVPPVSENTGEDEKDLQEGESLPITYHADTNAPFVVIAGKFTRTLRGEYQEIRLYKQDIKNGKVVKLPKTSPTTAPKNNVPSKSADKVQKMPTAPAIIQKVPHDTVSYEESKPQGSPKKANARKKMKFSFRDFMTLIPDDTENDTSKSGKLLDDYTTEKDADDIRTEIEKNLHTVMIRTVVLLITGILSVAAAGIMQFTPLFSESMRTGWLFYAIISFALFTIAVTMARLPIVNGLMPLRHLKGNSDTAAAVTALAVGIQSITALFTPHVFTDGTYHIYVPIAIIALLCNSIGKLLIILRTKENFKFLAKPFQKYAGKIYTDMKNAEKMTAEFPAKTTIIGYMKRSRFVSNFLRLSYAPDPSEELSAKIAPITACIALILGILYGLLSRNIAGGITSFALTACVGTPVMSLIVLNIPMKILCRNTLSGDAMISGYDAVQQFCDTNAIMVDSSQLYPEGTVTLSGMKVFRQSKLNDAMQAGAAVMYAVNGTLNYVFDNMVHCAKESLPKVDSIVYEDEKGLLAWVNKQRVLIGNRKLLETHNIKVPKKELEEKYLKNGSEITYISVNGELIVMFILSYKTDRKIARELRELEENGVSFIVRTIDPNVTKEKIAEKFGLFHRCITVLQTGIGNICHEVTSSVDEQSRAYLVTKGNIASFARAVSGCIKMKAAVMISQLLQCASIIFSIVIFTLISFVSGFQKLGSIQMLIYIVCWALFMIIAALVKKK